MKKTFLLFILLLQACASKEISSSYVGEVKNSRIYSVIAEDLVSQFSLEYPSGYTELALVLPEQKDEFSLIFETILRKKGFTLSNSASLKLSYILDRLESNEYYVKLSFDNKSLARIYGKYGKPNSNWTKKVSE